MTEKIYLQTMNRLKLGYEIRDDAEELIRISAPKKEVKKILFVSELVQNYAVSVFNMTEINNENTMWFTANKQAENLKMNLEKTIFRLKMYLDEYDRSGENA